MGFFEWLIGFLRKIGLLRVQGSSYKGNLKDKPASFYKDLDN